MSKLNLPSQAAGSNSCDRWKGIDLPAVGYQCVARIFALGDCSEKNSHRQLIGHIFHAMHGGINPTLKQRLIYLFCKQSLTADFRKWNVQNLIAGSLNLNQLNNHAPPEFFQLGFHPVRLPESQWAGASADAERRRH